MKLTIAGLLAAFLIGFGAARSETAEAPTASAARVAESPSLDLIKKLAGDWVMLGEGDKPTDTVASSFRVTAAGTAVVETLFPGTPSEMVTVYHMDGDALVLTHYCGLGNQPRLRVEKTDDPKVFAFNFVSCTNLKSEKAHHMHEAKMTLVSDDHIKLAWTSYKDGKAEEPHTFNLGRKKSEKK